MIKIVEIEEIFQEVSSFFKGLEKMENEGKKSIYITTVKVFVVRIEKRIADYIKQVDLHKNPIGRL
ncbi:MAG: hypothetical protein EAX96_20910 [Candidatus Lokiarchaeota archaeon]|nr:hypothetical protein [Candidatus Lokiarchaeota archaeon]